MLLGAIGSSHTHKADHHNLLIHSMLLGAIGCSLEYAHVLWTSPLCYSVPLAVVTHTKQTIIIC